MKFGQVAEGQREDTIGLTLPVAGYDAWSQRGAKHTVKELDY